MLDWSFGKLGEELVLTTKITNWASICSDRLGLLKNNILQEIGIFMYLYKGRESERERDYGHDIWWFLSQKHKPAAKCSLRLGSFRTLGNLPISYAITILEKRDLEIMCILALLSPASGFPSFLQNLWRPFILKESRVLLDVGSYLVSTYQYGFVSFRQMAFPDWTMLSGSSALDVYPLHMPSFKCLARDTYVDSTSVQVHVVVLVLFLVEQDRCLRWLALVHDPEVRK